LGDGRWDQRRVGDGGKRHEGDAVREVVEQVGGDPEAKARLADAASADEREEAHVVALQLAPHGRRFASAADERGQLGRQVVWAPVQGAERWERVGQAFGDELIDVLGLLEVFESALAEVAELSGPGRGVILMKPDDDRVVGALALGKKETFVVLMEDGGERTLDVDEVPAGHRAGKGQRVVKRGQVTGLRAGE
jgi:DNA gyrase/topoisomerase IV subunit A